MPESTLHRISEMIMKEAVEDKKMELTQSGMKITENDAYVMGPIGFGTFLHVWNQLVPNPKIRNLMIRNLTIQNKYSITNIT